MYRQLAPSGDVGQMWLVAPLVPQTTQPLAGADGNVNDRATLFVTNFPASGGIRMEHYTNVRRVFHVANTHPCVASAAPHKLHKSQIEPLLP